MNKYYVLKDGKAQKASIKEMTEFFENDEARRISKDDIDGVTVSTVFLCTDHNFIGEGPPILFETMIFGGENDQFQDRYSTLEEARNGHKVVVNAIRKGEKLE